VSRPEIKNLTNNFIYTHYTCRAINSISERFSFDWSVSLDQRNWCKKFVEIALSYSFSLPSPAPCSCLLSCNCKHTNIIHRKLTLRKNGLKHTQNGVCIEKRCFSHAKYRERERVNIQFCHLCIRSLSILLYCIVFMQESFIIGQCMALANSTLVCIHYISLYNFCVTSLFMCVCVCVCVCVCNSVVTGHSTAMIHAESTRERTHWWVERVWVRVRMGE